MKKIYSLLFCISLSLSFFFSILSNKTFVLTAPQLQNDSLPFFITTNLASVNDCSRYVRLHNQLNLEHEQAFHKNISSNNETIENSFYKKAHEKGVAFFAAIAQVLKREQQKKLIVVSLNTAVALKDVHELREELHEDLIDAFESDRLAVVERHEKRIEAAHKIGAHKNQLEKSTSVLKDKT